MDPKAAMRNDCLLRLYDADSELKTISNELDSFDGKKDPIRCNLLVNQLRTAQDKVISLLFQLMDEFRCERASRDYRMKFPDEILLSEGSESLNGQIWFGAECLSAGSNILNHTKESTMLRPMAKTLTSHLDTLRNDLRDLVAEGGGASRISQALIKKMVAFDHIFATFEYEYVRTMLPIRTVAEIEKLQEVAVLFSETLLDCVKRGLIKQDDIDEFQPIVMIAVPRLAIVRGLLYKSENPIYTRHKSQMCTLFQPFHGPLHSIRKLLRGLSPNELLTLERMLANDQTINDNPTASLSEQPDPSANDEQVDLVQQCGGEKVNNEQQMCRCEDESEAGTSNNYTNVLTEGLQYPVGQKRIVQNSSPNYFQFELGPSNPDTNDIDDPNSATESSSLKQQQQQQPTNATSANKVKTVTEDEALLEELFVKQAQQLLHRLFVAISGVADQLQSNFASDLRFILRHIFSSELEADSAHIDDADDVDDDDDNEDEDEDSDNREHSDSSLPIEEGIEAREVANLIDLVSNYSINGPYAYNHDMHYSNMPPASGNFPHYLSTNSDNSNDISRYTPSSSPYASAAQQINDSDSTNPRTNQDTRNQDVGEEMLADLMRAVDPTENIYDEPVISSPNEPSIMEESRHRQQLLQQHLQSLSRATSRSGSRSHRHAQISNSQSIHQHGTDRRSRHGGSRPRRPRGPPVWVPDQLVVACSSCNSPFTLFRRRHHCRACGQIFCGECSRFTKYLNCWGYNGPVRVCESCFNQP